jgi:hypothetical protein
MTLDEKGGFFSTTAARERVRQLEADLVDQGIKLFPNTQVGQRAHSLWGKIKLHLLRGGSVDVRCSTLKLAWHREELRRARSLLVGLQLIRPRSDGLYVLGQYDPLSLRACWSGSVGSCQSQRPGIGRLILGRHNRSLQRERKREHEADTKRGRRRHLRHDCGRSSASARRHQPRRSVVGRGLRSAGRISSRGHRAAEVQRVAGWADRWLYVAATLPTGRVPFPALTNAGGQPPEISLAARFFNQGPCRGKPAA